MGSNIPSSLNAVMDLDFALFEDDGPRKKPSKRATAASKKAKSVTPMTRTKTSYLSLQIIQCSFDSCLLATLQSKLSIKVARNKRGEKKSVEAKGKAKKVVLKKKKKAGEF